MFNLDEYLEFDTSPTNENGVQIGDLSAMRAEAKRMIALLEQKFPNVPGEFSIKREEHDFGSYLQIRYYFDSDDEDGWPSANLIENNWPTTWEDTTPVRM